VPNVNVGCLEQFTELIVNSPSYGESKAKSFYSTNSIKKVNMPPDLTEPTVPSTQQLLSSLPKPIQLPNPKNSSNENLLHKWLTSGKKIINAALSTDPSNESSDNQSLENFKVATKCLRVHPLECPDADVCFPCHVVAPKALFAQMTQGFSSNPVVCKITRLFPPKIWVEYKSEEGSKVHVEETQSKKDHLSTNGKGQMLFAYLVAFDDRVMSKAQDLEKDCVYLSNVVRRQLCLEIGSRIKLEIDQGDSFINYARSIEITPKVKDSKVKFFFFFSYARCFFFKLRVIIKMFIAFLEFIVYYFIIISKTVFI